MTFLRNAYIVLGAVLGIATVYLAPGLLSSFSRDKKSKSNEGKKSTGIYLIPSTQTENNQKEDDHGGEEREMEVSSLLVQNRSNEETIIDKSEKAIIDGIALIKDQIRTLLDNGESEKKSTDLVCAAQHQSNEEPVSGGTTSENLAPFNQTPDGCQSNEEPVSGGTTSQQLVASNQTPVQNQNNEVSNGKKQEKIIKKTYVKNGEKVVLQYVQTDEDKQLGNNDWNMNFKSMEESSSKYGDANDHFVSIPNEVLAPEKLNATIYESFEDNKKKVPFKPPRIRKVNRSESFKRSNLVNKNISIISSRKPSAQSTLLETNNNKIEVKGLYDIEVLSEQSNIHHNSTFESEHFRIQAERHKTLGHGLWRRSVNVLGNLLSWKRRASDRSKLLSKNYDNKISLIDLIEDDEASFTKYKKIT